MVTSAGARAVPELAGVDRQSFVEKVLSAGQPVVMRGLIGDWPLVRAAAAGPATLAAAIRAFDTGEPVSVMRGKPGSDGYFFYDETMTGFNFDRMSGPLGQLLAALLALPAAEPPLHLYGGPALSDAATARFAESHALPIVPAAARPRLWLSNASRVAAHYDVSRNVACVVSGTRRFTLLPPDQVANLYVGPFEHTMAGPTVSMVDFNAPDFDRFPRFHAAQAAAVTADLGPGDAIYIPTLWWHHVESFGHFNLLVNHWWKPEGDGPDLEALLIAILGLRDQPAPERAAWRAFFDHFVFADSAAQAADHLPPRWRTVTGPATAARNAMLLRFVLGGLNNRAGGYKIAASAGGSGE